MRLASDPDAALMQFLQTTYAAAADRGGWDRAAVETDPARWDSRRCYHAVQVRRPRLLYWRKP